MEVCGGSTVEPIMFASMELLLSAFVVVSLGRAGGSAARGEDHAAEDDRSP